MIILTSWDDGHPADVRLADLLSKYALQATFFIPIKNCEGKEVMGTSEIIQLNQSFEIGAHTLNHRYLKNLDWCTLNQEIIGGKGQLEDILGHTIDGFCYPGGKFDQTVIQAVKNAGFRYARTIENLQFNLGSSDWTMPTSFQFFPHSAATLFKNTLKYPHVFKIQSVLRRFFEKDFRKYLEKQLHFNSSGQFFHLWGHSWEIDDYNLWDELEQFFKFLSENSSRSMTLSQAHRQLL